jgi:hypothetical protein
MRQILVITLFLFNCSQDKETNQIAVILTPDKLELDNNLIDKKEFEKEFKIIVEKKLEHGYKKEELIINMKVDKNTRRGDVADIEVSLRRLNIRQIIYSSY